MNIIPKRGEWVYYVNTTLRGYYLAYPHTIRDHGEEGLEMDLLIVPYPSGDELPCLLIVPAVREIGNQALDAEDYWQRTEPTDLPRLSSLVTTINPNTPHN